MCTRIHENTDAHMQRYYTHTHTYAKKEIEKEEVVVMVVVVEEEGEEEETVVKEEEEEEGNKWLAYRVESFAGPPHRDPLSN